MNLRKGFSRIYTLLFGMVLLAVCTVGIYEIPKASDVDSLYAYEIRKLIPPGGATASAALQDTCTIWSEFSGEVKALCDGRKQKLSELPAKQVRHIAEMLMHLAIAAAVLHGIRLAARWVLDGFTSRS